MRMAPSTEIPRRDGVRSISALSGTPKTKLIGALCIIFAALGWGLNWPATKVLLASCPPLLARGAPGLLAGLILLGVAASCGETLVVPRHLWLRLALTSLLNVTAWMGLTTISLVWLPAGQAATLAYTMPLWAVLLAWPLLNERPTPRQIGAIILGIYGVIILLGAASSWPDQTKILGVSFALSAAVLFAFGTILSKRTPILLAPIASTAWQVILGCIPLLGGGLLLERVDFSSLPWFGWIALGYAAFISMGICYLLWFAALRRLNASSAAIGILLTPCVGVTASALALGDPLNLSQMLSLGLVGLGIVLAIKT